MQQEIKFLFCNALPCQEESFLAEVTNPAKDFIGFFRQDRAHKNRPNDWAAYFDQLVYPYMTLKMAFSKFGFEFVDECTSGMFRDKIAQTNYEVVILFSHCIHNGEINESIEFFDGLTASDDIIRMIPDRPARIYDFAVCHSPYLRRQGDLLKGNHVFGTSEKPVLLSIWLAIYAETFRNMVIKHLDFIDAFDAAVRASEEIRQKQ